jgi:hypothetical protein
MSLISGRSGEAAAAGSDVAGSRARRRAAARSGVQLGAASGRVVGRPKPAGAAVAAAAGGAGATPSKVSDLTFQDVLRGTVEYGPSESALNGFAIVRHRGTA